MKFYHLAWKRLTNTDAIITASGKHEIYFFELIYRVMYLCGLSTSDCTVLYCIYSFTIKSLLLLLFCCELWNFCTITWTIDAITDGLNVLIIQFGAFTKYQVVMSNRHVFKSLASSMLSENFDLSTKNRKKIFETWRRRNDASLKLLLGLGTITVIAWHIYPLVDDLEYNLMVSIKLPFNYRTPTLFPITYTCTLIVFSYISYFVMTNDLIMQVHLMHLLCQFDVLNDCFRNILADCQTEFSGINAKHLHLNKEFTCTYKKRLGNLVDQHIFILNNTLKIRDLMSTPMLIQLVISTTLICSIGFQVTTNMSWEFNLSSIVIDKNFLEPQLWSVHESRAKKPARKIGVLATPIFSVDVNVTKGLMGLFYLGYNMFVLYIICRWCEEIKIQSGKIGEAVYCSGWENGIVTVPGVRTSILLILARANNPTAMSAGGMYELSLKSYANMVKTSYTALTVLLRFR